MIEVKSQDIDLFKNLAQTEFEDVYYDFHNDYLCNNISLNNGCIEIYLNHIIREESVILKFFGAEIMKMNLKLFNELKGLTIDNLYRGRFEVNKELYEFNSNKKSFFYLDFYEGQSLDFFSTSLGLEKNKITD